ncbi:MAG: hypothetical protein AMXMBFR61_20580 [Fimbriimonadales bacterium]
MCEQDEPKVASAEKQRDSYTAQFAVREGRPVEEQPLPAEFQSRFETQTDYEWKRVYPAPKSEQALREYREGNRAFREDRVLDAIDAYRRCLDIEDYAPAQQNLAVAYLHEASAEAWRECECILKDLIARFEPLIADEQARTKAGLTLDQAASVLAPAYRNLAELYAQQGVGERSPKKLSEAAGLTRRALALMPQNLPWLLELWGIQHVLGNADEAAAALKQAAELEGFDTLVAHAREKYIALQVKYHAG